jgi:hypothetical protein
MTHDQIMGLLDAERERQADKWHGLHDWGRGDCSSPDVPILVKGAVLAEEAGEVLQAILDDGPGHAGSPWVLSEVVQTLAVAYAILEGW